MDETEKQDYFKDALIKWYLSNTRELPWKGIKNPYHIWLSEIILQQTRVEQGLPYYNRFILQYPTIQELANAPEDELFKLWEGLGYYSRAKNLHATAKVITNKYQGNFPTTYEDIRALKGIGDYTAAAIASFAYDLPYAVVDGNVYRVLARYFGIHTPIDSSEGKKEFRVLADSLLDVNQPARHNQAIMDLGAVHCKYKFPSCLDCLLKSNCSAWNKEEVSQLPVKSKKLEKKDRFFYYLLIKDKKQVLLNKRAEKDIWSGLYDFPLIELDKLVEGLFLVKELQQTEKWEQLFGNQVVDVLSISKTFKQTLSHQKINAVFVEIEDKSSFFVEKDTYIVVEQKKIKNFAFPKVITNYLGEKESLFLG